MMDVMRGSMFVVKNVNVIKFTLKKMLFGKDVSECKIFIEEFDEM